MGFNDLNKKDLYKIAKMRNVKNRSKMTKPELIEALKKSEITDASLKSKVDGSSSYTEMIKDESSKEPAKVEFVEEEYPIPGIYDVDTIVLMPVDPSTEFCYWQVSSDTREQYKEHINRSGYKIKIFMKADGAVSGVQELDVGESGNYYFHHYLPGKTVWAEIGVTNEKGEFLPVLSSKKVSMPTDRLSDVTDEMFMNIKEHYSEILKLSGIQDKTRPGSLEFHRSLLNHMLKNITSKGILKRS